MRAESPGKARDTGAVTDFTPVESAPVDAVPVQPAPIDPEPAGIRAELSELDARLYAAVAGAHTPTLDAFFRRCPARPTSPCSGSASPVSWPHVGGRTGRRAAVNGVASIALASATANLVGKRVTNRSRPDRVGHDVPEERHVPMPTSTSFPSGHSASAFAFAEGVGAAAPALGVPVRLLAVAVSYSRVHTGVHYPGDVVAGALIGLTSGEVACRSLAFARRRWDIP